MARKPDSPPKEPERRARATRVADLVPAVGGKALKRLGFTQAALAARWPEIVGPRYARHSRPEALSFPRGKKDGGTLKVAVTGALAPMLRHVEAEVVARVNQLLGYGAVAKLALIQGDFDVAVPPPPVPPPELAAETRSTLRDIADPDLRASLEALALALTTSKGPPVVR